jgi:hypothetical protein
MMSGRRSPGPQLLIHWIATFGLFLLIFSGEAKSQEPLSNGADNPQWIQSADRGSSSTWFSKEDRTAVFPDVPTDYERDILKDRAKNVAQPKQKSNWNWDWGFPDGFWETISIIGIAAILMSIITALLYFFWSDESWSYAKTEQQEKKKNAIKPASLSDLPFQVESTPLGTLDAARLAMNQGDYSKAIIYLFSHMLLELDMHSRIRLQRGKTNGMYLREVRRSLPLHGIVQRVAFRFEQSFFGNIELTREQFMDCWNSLEEFERLVSTPVEETKANSEIPKLSSRTPAIAPFEASS